MKNSIDVDVVDSHRYFIDAIIDGNTDNAWRFTGFYGEPETYRRSKAWSKLRSLNSRVNIPWICGGDFNEIVRKEEKWGRIPRDHNQMQLFRDVIDECQFMDLGYVGPKFTWVKHYVDGHSIRIRLDRCMATNFWFQKFPGTRIHHLNCMSSDHSPLLINLSGLPEPRKKRCFRFEEMWLSDPTCGETVEEVWSNTRESNPSIAILKKVAKCEQELTWWNKHNFGHVRRELESKKNQLVLAENEAMVSGNNTRVRSLRVEINSLQDRESRMWCQRSRVLWLSKGDNNTAFFHSKATKRFRKNLIRGIRDRNGAWLTDQEDIGHVMESYYNDLFSISSLILVADSLEKIPCLVTDEMNAELMKEFTELEVKEALNQMAPLKAPGPDGMPPLFYRHFWAMMQHDVTSAILSWLNSGTLPKPINHTLITFIPKIANPEHVSEFRPISLCNVLYKIYSKVLANRLKNFLPFLITKHQSAFAKDRLISDNIMVAFETLHHMKQHNSGKHGFMAIKLDMSKAYDRVEWVYLERLLEKMGFCDRWVALMMSCVKTLSYFIIVNGEPTGMI